MKANTLLLILTLLSFGLTNASSNLTAMHEIEHSQTDNDPINLGTNEQTTDMKTEIITSMTFQDGNAEEAMDFYLMLFDNTSLTEVHRWGPEMPAAEGKIMQARFELNGKKFMISDSPIKHEWDFSPAIAMYVECSSENELIRYFEKLSEDGQVAMPVDNYGFSQKFAWVIDRFGVSWQLNWQ